MLAVTRRHALKRCLMVCKWRNYRKWMPSRSYKRGSKVNALSPSYLGIRTSLPWLSHRRTEITPATTIRFRLRLYGLAERVVTTRSPPLVRSKAEPKSSNMVLYLQETSISSRMLVIPQESWISSIASHRITSTRIAVRRYFCRRRIGFREPLRKLAMINFIRRYRTSCLRVKNMI